MESKLILKFEIKKHDGPSRLIHYKKTPESEIITGPLLVNNQKIPQLHTKIKNNKTYEINSNTSSINIGYLPSLQYFNKFESGGEFLEILKTDYSSYALENNLDFIALSYDRAHNYRQLIQYPYFIQKVLEKIPDQNWAVSMTKTDSLDIWKMKPKMIILGEFSFHSDFSRDMWKYISKIKSHFPTSLLYAPAVHPLFMPLLSYLGVDMFDTMYSEYLAHLNKYLTWNLDLVNLTLTNNLMLPCSCPICHKKEKKVVLTLSELKEHNKYFTLDLVKLIQNSIINNQLRDLVKLTVKRFPSLAGMLRLIDQEKDFLKAYVNLEQSVSLQITDGTDYVRPEINLYGDYLQNRYQVSEDKWGIILIPCSARKPYSESNSHKRISEAIKKGLGKFRYGLEEWIITSPLGIVPRFLEGVYPSKFYDITVTGHWSEQEYLILRELYINMLKKISSDIPIIAYLPEPEKGLIHRIAKETDRNIEIIEFKGRASSQEGLDVLTKSIQILWNDLDTKENYSKQQWLIQKFRAITDYQFGKGIGEHLIPEGSVFRFRGFKELVEFDKKQLAVITKESGLLTLTLDGINRIIDHVQGLKVIFDGDEISGSALYCSGISHADLTIKPGNEVFVFNNNDELLGVGKTNLTGRELQDLTYGLGVSLRKKVKKQ
jgi:archaeosine synthase